MKTLKGNDLEQTLKEFQNKAIATYKEMEKGEEYPFPSILPVGLFNCLKHGKLETDYTRTLAYLLDEKEKHGYGNKFMQVLCEKLKMGALQDYIVCPEKYCENGRYDIFIKGKSGAKDCLIVIEAKIDSDEGENQLGKYNEDLKKYNADIKKIFLTVNKEKTPSQEDWLNWTWQDIINLLWKVIKYKKYQKQAGYYFCKYFISSIYSNVYDVKGDNISLYNCLVDEEIQEYADKIETAAISNEIFIKYPSALSTLYDYTAEKSKFDESYLKWDKHLRENIKNVWNNVALKLNKTINNKAPTYWNKYYVIEGTQICLNIGVKGVATKLKGVIKENLYWFYNVHFEGKNRFELLQKMQDNLKSKLHLEVMIPLNGENILLGTRKYNGEKDLTYLEEDIVKEFKNILIIMEDTKQLEIN